jgi:hypothetical protein
MANIDVNLPTMDAASILTVFPELETATVVALATSEGTIEINQKASDWADLCQVQADTVDAVAVADSEDVRYQIKALSTFPAYQSALDVAQTFKGSNFDANGHKTLKTTIAGGSADDATTLKLALRYDISEDMFGTKDAYEVFSNQTELDADFEATADDLETAVLAQWAALRDANTESLGAGILSNTTAEASNPIRTIVQAVLANTSHTGGDILVNNLVARSTPQDYAACPLSIGDVLNFNITFSKSTATRSGQDIASTGMGSSSVGAQDHIFKVKVTLV